MPCLLLLPVSVASTKWVFSFNRLLFVLNQPSLLFNIRHFWYGAIAYDILAIGIIMAKKYYLAIKHNINIEQDVQTICEKHQRPCDDYYVFFLII